MLIDCAGVNMFTLQVIHPIESTIHQLCYHSCVIIVYLFVLNYIAKISFSIYFVCLYQCWVLFCVEYVVNCI